MMNTPAVLGVGGCVLLSTLSEYSRLVDIQYNFKIHVLPCPLDSALMWYLVPCECKLFAIRTHQAVHGRVTRVAIIYIPSTIAFETLTSTPLIPLRTPSPSLSWPALASYHVFYILLCMNLHRFTYRAFSISFFRGRGGAWGQYRTDRSIGRVCNVVMISPLLWNVILPYRTEFIEGGKFGGEGEAEGANISMTSELCVCSLWWEVLPLF